MRLFHVDNARLCLTMYSAETAADSPGWGLRSWNSWATVCLLSPEPTIAADRPGTRLTLDRPIDMIQP
jgi:hypothetical protein